MAYEIQNKQYFKDRFGDYLRHPDGEYLYEQGRPVVYSDDTITSMISPQPYAGGWLPYGYCVTDGTYTYQVNKYLGTANNPIHSDWDNLGAGISFTPISTPADLHAVRAVSTRVFGTGTKWQDTYTTTGLAGHYIQVADIDLTFDTQNVGGDYYDSGAGWNRIHTFTGHYDGGGRPANGMYLNRTQNDSGLFGAVQGVVRNLFVVNAIFKNQNYGNGIIAGRADGGEVYNCIAHGTIYSFRSDNLGLSGGIIGSTLSTAKVYNCFSAVSIVSQTDIGGIGGRIIDGVISDSVAVGNVLQYSGNIAGGALGDLRAAATANNLYANSETSGQTNYIGKPASTAGSRTTAELLAGTPSAGIYTDWDTNIWDFSDPTIYPVHKFFGILGISLPPPTGLTITDNGATWQAAWTAPDKEPHGYYVFVSYDGGAWEKVNTESVAATQLDFTAPTAAGTYNYFVTAEYYNKPYKAYQETGNGVTLIQTII